MNAFIETDGFKNKISNEVLLEMASSYKNRVKAKIQRECDFFHLFKDERINSELVLNGNYHVIVTFTPDDNHWIIDAITVQDTVLSYPVDFDISYQNNNVYQHAMKYIYENDLARED